MTALFRSLAAAFAVGACASCAGAPFGGSLTAGGDGAASVYDSVLETGVGLGGGHVSLMFARETEVSAVGVAGIGSGMVALSISDNYRDWRLIGEARLDAGMTIVQCTPFVARFVRVAATPSLDRSAVLAEVAAGTLAEVEEQAALLEPFDWGYVSETATIHAMMDAVYDWQVTRLTDQTGWISATFHAGTMALYRSTGDEQYRQDLIDFCNGRNWKLLARSGTWGLYHADDHCMGQTYVELYEASPAERQASWIADVQARLDMVMANPRSGRQDYSWCDALFMAPPVYGRLAAVTGDGSYLDFIDGQWWDSTDYLYDDVEHLYYRDSSYFDDVEANGEPVFWSRGNGWVIAGLARMLQYMPEDFPSRASYETLLGEMATRLAEIQQPNGLWTSSLLYPGRFDGEPEASGSAFFVYAIAWGINEGILDEATFAPVVEAGWQGLTQLVLQDGRIASIQQVGAGPAKITQTFTGKDYGYGAFLLAASEMVRYYEGQPKPIPLRATTGGADGSAGPMVAVDPTGDPAAWQKLADFQNGSLAAWTITTTGGNGVSEIIDDPFGPAGNKVLHSTPGTVASQQRFHTLPLGQMPTTGKVTLYVRFASEGPETNTVWGLSDATTVAGWGDFEASVRMNLDPILDARVAGNYVEITDDYTELRTWQELWIVADVGSDTFDIYLSGGAQRRGLDRLISGASFRNGPSSNPIRSFGLITYSLDGDDSFYVDDVYYTLGENLTRPQEVTVPQISVFSEELIHHDYDLRNTFLGWVYDPYYPWIYSYEVSGWLWVQHPDGLQPLDAPNSFYGWSAGNPAGWIWTDPDYNGWYYSYDLGGWIKAGN